MTSSGVATIDLVIRIREDATTDRHLVRLGDCADIITDDGAFRQQLEELTLFPTPAAGRRMTVDYDWIRARLSAHGVNLARVDFTGSPQVTVVGPSVEVDESRVQKPKNVRPVIQQISHRAAERSLTNRDRDHAHQLVIKQIREKLIEHDPDWSFAEIVTELNDEEIELVVNAVPKTWNIHSASEAESTETGYRQLWTLSFADRAGVIKQVAVTTDILPPHQILTLRHTVPSGHVLRAEDLKWTVESTRGSDTVSWDDVIGKETVRSLRASSPVTKSDVRRPILVRRSDIVTVTVDVRGIRVRREFKANGQGGWGETIPLTSLDGRHKITARIVGLHEAQIITEPRIPSQGRVLSDEQRAGRSLPAESLSDGTGIRISINNEPDRTSLPSPTLRDVFGGQPAAPPPGRWKQNSANAAVPPVGGRQSSVDDEHDVGP